MSFFAFQDIITGTAGFLISAYKHIQAANRKDGHNGLTPDEKKRLYFEVGSVYESELKDVAKAIDSYNFT